MPAALPDEEVIAPASTERPGEGTLPVRYGALIGRLAASLLIAGGFIWAMRKGGLPLIPPASELARIDLSPVAFYTVACGAATLMRTYRWNHLLRPINSRLSSRRVLAVSCVGLAAVLFAPLRMGEIVRPWLLAQDREVSFVHAAGTVVAERIVDGLTLTGVLAVSLWFATPLSPLPDHIGTLQVPVALVPAISMSAFGTFCGAFIAMLLFYFWRVRAHRIVYTVVAWVSVPLANWLTRQVERLADSLQFLFSRKHGVAFMRETVGYWAATIVGHYVLLRGLGIPASFVQTCVTLGVLGLSTLLPSGPGFFGTYQLGIYCGLAMFFPASQVLGAGALFTFLSYAIQLLLGLLCGVLGMWLLSITPRTPRTPPQAASSSARPAA